MPSKLYTFLFSVLVFLVFFFACQEPKETKKKDSPSVSEAKKAAEDPLFSLLPAEKTMVTFRNTLSEDLYSNILMYPYFYNGGGVAVGDINNDGLDDLYFSANMTPNRLYLNRGNMEFMDITQEAGVLGKESAWKTGVSMADVNADGLLDIYLCYSGNMPVQARTNELFINQGPDSTGMIRFIEKAAEYGLADASFSTNSYFFDYDRDGDLDMLLLNHNPATLSNLDDYSIQEIQKKPAPDFRLKLYRNTEGKFADVSDKAGFYNSAFSYGLGAGIADFNKDGWPDIYVSNDYSAPDILFINKGNGTFTNTLRESMGHTPLYSMGNDVSDFNNDGLPDVFALDMLPEDNKRQKLLFTPDNYEYFNIINRAGFHYQYMRNMLQINNGNSANGTPSFSEAGQLAGISNTDWSWAPLFADYDNDGWKDLFITNGFLKDFTNLDFIKYKSSFFQNMSSRPDPRKTLELIDNMPSSKVKNYLFRNNGNLTFSNKGTEWGINTPSNSNGAAYADLDNDGDLDLIVNNINQPAFIYQNGASQKLNHHYLKLQLKGSGKNTAGIGAKVILRHKGMLQYQEQMPSKGYQSAVSPVMHFGLGAEESADTLQIIWPGGKQQIITQVKGNQLIVLNEIAAVSKRPEPAPGQPLFKEVKSPVKFTHHPVSTNDFKRQPLLINPLSFSGPCLAKADVNGDGLEDIFAGGTKGQAGVLFLQQKNGQFAAHKGTTFEADKESEDTDALFFDANKDGKPDLYVASGGYGDFLPDDPLLQDRLYLNNGQGNFTRSSASLPQILSSTACVRSADVNADGFPDLFLGSRVIPGRYPETPKSYLLVNNGSGDFKDMTTTIAPDLQNLGLVSDAAWHDLNGDGSEELLVVGEWMPLKVFKNSQGRLTDDTQTYFSKDYSGWWNTLWIGDLNNDGKPDIVAGNHGLNSQAKASEHEPAELFFKDFDNNGSTDPIFSFYIQGKSYPYVTRDELLDQISMMRTRFTSYESYSGAGLNNIFTPEELKGAEQLSARHLSTTYFENSSAGKFTEKELPAEAQLSPVFAIQELDYNQDGNPDLLLCGNITQARLRFGKYDANYGVLLEGNGKGEFTYVPQNKSGFLLKGDVRSIISVNNTLLFGINQQEIKAYKPE